MSEYNIGFFANFRPLDDKMPSIENQYADLWSFALLLQTIGISLDDWYPPADTPENSLLNNSFDKNGVTKAALAMALAANKKKTNVRTLGAWNGIDEEGGMAFTTMVSAGLIPSNFDFSASNSDPLRSFDNVLKILHKIIEIWAPILVQISPYEYKEKRVFKDKPGVGWIIYLPFVIENKNVPEASDLIPIYDENKRQKGTIVVSVKDTFDANNPEHVKRANEIEIRLVDQDLLPKTMDFLKIK